MRRRDLMLLLGGAAVACPLATRGQQPARFPRVGVLSDETPSLGTSFGLMADGLRSLGWVEGQNIAFERRYAEEKNEILPSLAGELVRLEPDVIVAIGTAATRAAKIASETIPIVFARVSDPVGLGFVAALARPGGNLTGVSLQTRELAAKRLELLITAVPDVKRVGVLWDPRLPSGRPEIAELEGGGSVSEPGALSCGGAKS